ncbi:MAG: hypothetical protein ACRC0X_02975 [Brevinema sp.]
MGENTEDLGNLSDDELEGIVYEFQTGISWDGVNTEFKANVIKAMRELYCHQRKQYIPWRILEISSAYRNPSRQAQAMVDYQLVIGRHQLATVYDSLYDNALQLISNLFYDGNHLGCTSTCMTSNDTICKYGIMQQAVLKGLPSNEQEAFYPYFNKTIPHGNIDLKNNKAKIKDLLELWIIKSDFESEHTRNKALDFSKNTTKEQREKFTEILLRDNIKLSSYSTGNFHIQPF